MKAFISYKKLNSFTRFLVFSTVLGLVVSVSVFSLIPMFVSAIYAPGFTLDPDCLPTDSDCTVSNLWSNSGTDVLFNQTGNLGVGTSSPLAKLDIYGNASSAALFTVSSSSNTRLFTITNSGWVGIGTTTPGNNLEVNTSEDDGGIAVKWYNGAGYASLITKSGQSGVIKLNEGGFGGSDKIVFSARSGQNSYFNNGNLGIGTTTPARLLDIVGGTNNVQIRLSDSATDSLIKNSKIVSRSYSNSEEDVLGLQLYNSAVGSHIGIGGGSSLQNSATSIGFYTSENVNTLSGINRMAITASGNIGIGSTSPLFKLTVTGNTYISDILSVASTTGFSNFLGNLSIGTTSNETTRLIIQGSGISSSTSALSILNASSTSLFYINNGGGVSIGTTSPVGKLHVEGVSSDSSYLISAFTNPSTGTNADGYILVGQGTRGSTFGANYNDNYGFWGLVGQIPTMYIKNGNVGIGTSSPLSALTVAGDAMITGRLFDNTNSAGLSGMVLQSTGTGFNWVPTSTLNISSAVIVPELVTLTSGTTTLTSADNGKLFTNAGTTGDIILQLPSRASVGNNFEISITNEAAVGLTGGTVTLDGAYGINTFTSDGTLTVPAGVTAQVLIVGGGGSAAKGAGGMGGGGGGGGGGVVSTTTTLIAGNYSIDIGAGGISPATMGNGTVGENSSFNSIIAYGGLGGRHWNDNKYGGASGAPQSNAGGVYNGGNYAGGGGGGGSVGGTSSPDPYGGIGFVSTISGTSTYYAGGGGGGNYGGVSIGIGGLGGGGKGSDDGTNGAANTGGGGGGPYAGGVAGNGGSGIVIVRYALIAPINIVPASGDQLPITSVSDNSIKSFTKGDFIKLRSTDVGWVAESITPTLTKLAEVTGNPSSRALKENFVQLDKQDILNKIADLDMTEWNYISQPDGIKHIGPIAEDFYAKFGLGGTDTSISTIDPAGVALVGIQALNKNFSSIFGTSSISAFAESTTTMETYAVTDFFASMVQSALKKLSAVFIPEISTNKITVGTSVKPSGMTIYDEDTKEPYCMKIKNGAMVTVSGACIDIVPTETTPSIPVAPTATVIDSIPTETPTSTTTEETATSTEETITTTEETATTTEPIIEPEATSTEPVVETPASEPIPDPLVETVPTEPVVDTPDVEPTPEPVVETPPAEEPTPEPVIEAPTPEPTPEPPPPEPAPVE
jgi:hypothetical protein